MAEVVIMRPELVSEIIIVNGVIGLGSHSDTNLLPFPLRSEILRQYITADTTSNPMLTKILAKLRLHYRSELSGNRYTLTKAAGSIR